MAMLKELGTQDKYCKVFAFSAIFGKYCLYHLYSIQSNISAVALFLQMFCIDLSEECDRTHLASKDKYGSVP